MEINLEPTSEIPNQQGGVVVGNSEEQARSPTQAQARLYECSFCKKGFSNAQALGGHMNIHRKDKAKLKQASKENQKLLDAQGITTNPLTSSGTSGNIGKPLELTSSPVLIKSSTNWPPSTFSSDQEEYYESHMAELKQLQLFVEAADYSNPIMQANSVSWQGEFISGQGSFGAELDLELRLGHEPPRSSVAMGTRKFL